MEIKQMLLTPSKFTRPQTKLNKVTKIAIHYVGNAGSTAEANRNYFESLKSGTNNVYASSHYIVGLKGEIIRCIPETEISYCTNQANGYTISIEHCHPDGTGKPNIDTYKALIELCADLCRRYNLKPLEDIIRHYDVTGKKCPLWFVNNPVQWDNFKKDVLIYMREAEEVKSEMKIIVNNGPVQSIESILNADSNYPKLRPLMDALGVKVDYDINTKIIRLTTK